MSDTALLGEKPLPGEEGGTAAAGAPATFTVHPGWVDTAIVPSLHSPVRAEDIEVTLRVLPMRPTLDL